MTERKEAVRAPGGLKWERRRVFFPVRFTHDADGYLLLNQPGRRQSRMFETVLCCDGTGLPGTAYRPSGEGKQEVDGE